MISPTGTGAYNYGYNTPMLGVRRAFAQMDGASEKISQGDVSAQNMVKLMESEKMAKASMVALRTQDDVIGTLLNIKV